MPLCGGSESETNEKPKPAGKVSRDAGTCPDTAYVWEGEEGGEGPEIVRVRPFSRNLCPTRWAPTRAQLDLFFSPAAKVLKTTW
jgi:hypothetical protein